jgi:uncharacterized membrane protein
MRLAPRLALCLPLSALVALAQAAGQGVAAAGLAAALIGAWLAPTARGGGILMAAAAAGGATAFAAARPGGAEAVLAALPVVGTLLLAWHFGRTLAPGREALIARYSRAEHGTLPPGVGRYAWWLTFAWAALFLAFAVLVAAGTAGAGPSPARSAAAMAALSAVLFLGEHALRARLFPALGPARPWRTLRAIWRVDAAADAR